MTDTSFLDLNEQATLQRLHDGKAERFEYPGLLKMAHCFVSIEGGDSQAPTVMLSEADDNYSTSITNAYEDIATLIHRLMFPALDPRNIRWLEHYPSNRGLLEQETVDRVSLQWDARGKHFHSPQWASVPLQKMTA